MAESFGYMGTLPELGSPDIENQVENEQDLEQETAGSFGDFLRQSNTYVGKVNQTDVSVPLSMAAIGNTEYIDMYALAGRAGFRMDAPDVPGVVLSDEDRGLPTGFAVSAQGSSNLSDIKSKVDLYAKKHGIPLEIAHALVNQESGYNPNARSKAGAQGLLQLMPATAKELGVTNAFDIDQNLNAGFGYLASKFAEFGTWEYALASYNAGSGAVKKFGGIPPYPETQKYVKNIMGQAPQYRVGIRGTYPASFPFEGNQIKFLDKDTGGLRARGVNDLMYVLNQGPYKGEVKFINTNRPELLENKPEYAAFAKYRSMKGADGKPLFRKGGNYNGFKVHVSNKAAIAAGVLNKNATPALADDVAKTQTDALPKVDRDKIEATLNTFADRYNAAFKKGGILVDTGSFGLANLTAQEYINYGVNPNALHNPVMQARVLNQEFQRAVDILGSERKAIFALAGGKLGNNTDDAPRSWREIKADKENFTKNWFLRPSGNAKEREAINELVAKYDSEYRRIRGV
jgi:hypothetical protein